MNRMIRIAMTCLVALSCFLSFTASAQVQTARPGVAVSAKCGGYYEYLPQGYSATGTTTYPLLLFITGIGEFGSGSSTQLPRVLENGPPKLIKNGTFPTSFSVLGQTFKFIVITPQFKSTPVVAEDVDAVLQYMIAHYKVDPKRIYLSGLSYGGGLCFAYTGRNATFASKIAAIVPTATPLPNPPETGYDTIYARSRVIAAGNVPVWATHNSGDTPDSASRTTAYINNINLAPAPNPLAKKTIFSANGHDSWGRTYDPDFREGGYNIYEWMLLYQKGTTPPTLTKPPTANAGADKTVTLPTNSVSITATGSDPEGSALTYSWKQLYGPATATISAPTSATTTLGSLVQGYYAFRVTVSDNKGAKATDDVKVTVNATLPAGTKLIQVNVYGGANAYSNTAWNNWSVGSGAGTAKTSAAFKYSDGTTSTVTGVLSATTAANDNGSTYSGGIAPPEVLRYASSYNGVRTLTLKGLSTVKSYKLEFYASRASSAAGNTIFKIGTDSVSVSVNGNYTSKASFANVKADASGQIVVTINKSNTSSYLNGFSVTESASTTVKYVKTNLYAGTNAYTSTEWNNWNTGSTAATGKNSGALKYSDGTASTITALLSATTASGDNGSSYGGVMAPAQVLRYSSNHNATRTLTLSGLSTTKMYDLELYASRSSSTTNNNTIFTVGSASVTINVNNNLTNKAVFSNLKTTDGQIIITIAKTNTYNYLNGFVLTEITTTGSTIKGTGAPLEAVTEGNNPAARQKVAIFPNPAGSTVKLQLQNTYQGAVEVQLSDAEGRAHQTWRFVKSGTALQQTLPVNGLSKGVYFITVQMGGTRQTLPISKL